MVSIQNLKNVAVLIFNLQIPAHLMVIFQFILLF